MQKKNNGMVTTSKQKKLAFCGKKICSISDNNNNNKKQVLFICFHALQTYFIFRHILHLSVSLCVSLLTDGERGIHSWVRHTHTHRTGTAAPQHRLYSLVSWKSLVRSLKQLNLRNKSFLNGGVCRINST